MRHPVIITLSFFFITLFTLLQLDMRMPTITGAVIAEEEPALYAHTLDHVANKLLGTVTFQFPSSCGQTAQELYDSIAHLPLEVTSGFRTNGENRVASLNFGMDRYLGTVDIVTGNLNQNNPEETLLSLGAHSTIRMPPGIARITFLRMNLYGNRNGIFVISRGDFSTPSLDCAFTVTGGKTECTCEAHPHTSSTYETWTEA